MVQHTCKDCRFYMTVAVRCHERIREMLRGTEGYVEGEYGVCELHDYHPAQCQYRLTPATREACTSIMVRDDREPPREEEIPGLDDQQPNQQGGA